MTPTRHALPFRAGLLSTLAALTAAALASLAVPRPANAAAHGEAVLRAERTSVPAGDGVALEGEGFAAGETYRIRLLGPLDAFDLASVRPDSAGRVAVRTRVPAEAPAGRYRLVAVAPDGDRVASVDFTVLEPAPGPPAEPSGAAPDGPGDPSGSAVPGTKSVDPAEELPIERSRSGLEWGLIGLLLGFSGGFGLRLFRRAADAA